MVTILQTGNLQQGKTKVSNLILLIWTGGEHTPQTAELKRLLYKRGAWGFNNLYKSNVISRILFSRVILPSFYCFHEESRCSTSFEKNLIGRARKEGRW
jgi:hypothetical protein